MTYWPKRKPRSISLMEDLSCLMRMWNPFMYCWKIFWRVQASSGTHRTWLLAGEMASGLPINLGRNRGNGLSITCPPAPLSLCGSYTRGRPCQGLPVAHATRGQEGHHITHQESTWFGYSQACAVFLKHIPATIKKPHINDYKWVQDMRKVNKRVTDIAHSG